MSHKQTCYSIFEILLLFKVRLVKMPYYPCSTAPNTPERVRLVFDALKIVLNHLLVHDLGINKENTISTDQTSMNIGELRLNVAKTWGEVQKNTLSQVDHPTVIATIFSSTPFILVSEYTSLNDHISLKYNF